MANRLGIDPDKFKHVSSDKNSTTLEHKDGHKLTIAHNVLSPKMKAQLQELAKASTKYDDERDEKKESKDKYGKVTVKEDKEQPVGKVQVVDDEGRQKLAEGEMVEAQPQETEQPQAQMDPALVRKREIYNNIAGLNMTGAPTNPVEKMFGPNGEAPKAFDAQSWQQSEQNYAKEKETNAADAAGAQQKVIALNAQRVAAGLDPLPVPNVPEGPQIPGSQPSEVAPEQSASGQGLAAAGAPRDAAGQSMGDMEGMMQSGYNQKMGGINQQAQAQGALGQEQAALLQKNIQAKQDAQIQYQKQYDGLESERQMHMKDIQDAHIDPNKYWTGDKDGNGGHSKIASAIGMILAGFTPNGAPNAAVNLLKFQMDKSMEAQKENLGKQKTLLEANLRQFGNLKDATDMTRVMMSDIMTNELQAAAAKAQSPMAKAAAMQAVGDLQMQTAPIMQQFAMRKAMMNMAGNGGDPQSVDHMLGYMRVMNPEMAKEMQSRYVPGIGMASVPIPDPVRQSISAHQTVNDTMNQVLKFAKQHAGTLDPKLRSQANTLMNQLQSQIRVAEQQGVYKESEAEFMTKTLGDSPASVLAKYNTVPKIKQLQQLKSQELDNTLKTYGLKAPHLGGNEQQQSPDAAMQWAKSNPNDPRAAKILQRLGK